MEGSDKIKLLVVCGATASGKTELALHLARTYNGELVGADSMQIYKGLTIGTAALTAEKAKGVPQHLVGFLPPEQQFSVADYAAAAHAVIKEIAGRNKLPILCGGTGLYIDAIVNGLRFTEQKTPKETQDKLEYEWNMHSPEAMLAKLALVDPECAARLHPADKKRVLRALEQIETTGLTLQQRNQASRPQSPPYTTLCIAPTFADRATLYNKIEQRVDGMMQAGLLDEARQVYAHRLTYKTAVQAIGYKEFFPFFEGLQTLEACICTLKQATRHYAKRQFTWFNRMKDIRHVLADDAIYTNSEHIILEMMLFNL